MPSLADQFPAITRRNEPLAPHTRLKIGGPAEFLIEPGDVDELRAVLKACGDADLPVRMLGGGFNLATRQDSRNHGHAGATGTPDRRDVLGPHPADRQAGAIMRQLDDRLESGPA